MRVKLIKDWRGNAKGDEVEMNVGPAMALVAREYAVRVEEGRRTASVAHEAGKKSVTTKGTKGH